MRVERAWLQKGLLYPIYAAALLLLLLVPLVQHVHEARYRRLLLVMCMFLALLHVGVWLSRSVKAMLLMAFVDIGLAVVAAGLFRQMLFVFDYDTWTHIELARQVALHGPFPGDPHLAGEATPPFLSLIHWILGGLHRVTGIEVAALWQWSGVVGILLRLLAILFLAVSWFRRADVALAAVLIAASLSCLTATRYLYPFLLGGTLLWWALWCRSELDARRRRRPPIAPRVLWHWTVALGILYGLCTATHLWAGVMCTMVLILHEGILVLREPPLRRLGWAGWAERLVYLPIGWIVASPWLVATLRQMISARTGNTWHYVTDFPRLFGLWQVADWGRLIDRTPAILLLLSLIGLFLTLRPIRRGIGFRLLPAPSQAGRIFLWISVGLPLVALTTPLFTLLMRCFGHAYPIRLAGLLGIPFLAAYALTPIVQLPRHRLGEGTLRVHIALCGAVLGSFALLITLRSGIDIRQRLRVLGNFPIVDSSVQPAWGGRLRQETAGGIVLTDPYSAYMVPYLLHAKVVAIDPSHTSPFVDPSKRLEAVETVLNPASDDDRITAALEAWRVTHVLLNLEPVPGRSDPRFAPIQSAYPAGLAERLADHPRLRLVEEGDGIVLFRVKR